MMNTNIDSLVSRPLFDTLTVSCHFPVLRQIETWGRSSNIVWSSQATLFESWSRELQSNYCRGEVDATHPLVPQALVAIFFSFHLSASISTTAWLSLLQTIFDNSGFDAWTPESWEIYFNHTWSMIGLIYRVTWRYHVFKLNVGQLVFLSAPQLFSLDALTWSLFAWGLGNDKKTETRLIAPTLSGSVSYLSNVSHSEHLRNCQ